MTVTKFEAKIIHMQSDKNSISISFAESEFEASKYLLLQKQLSLTDRESAAGFYNVYIEYGDQLNSAYGGIQKCTLQSRKIKILLDATIASKIGTEENVEVGFLEKRVALIKLKEHFELLFRDEPEIFKAKY